ncbi:hypothetical protein TorRG33x02_309170 [Trema orientale]|uniref:Uncharacterized protein n=1 Tax=Trema orientale TaxID=63057 RepID=A0A2P5BTR5_TREOI|nr:hypothetical protein TorRG33x02_309170 [Trema orientale]
MTRAHLMRRDLWYGSSSATDLFASVVHLRVGTIGGCQEVSVMEAHNSQGLEWLRAVTWIDGRFVPTFKA